MVKIIKWILIIIGIFAVLAFFLSRGYVYPREELSYGVTFSKKQAVNLGLDWREAYTAVLDDLGVRQIRLAAYWDEVEPEEGIFAWDDLDWQINEAAARGAKIILAAGGRLPRWPECHFPSRTKGLSEEERGEKILKYLEQVINRYQGEEAIIAWQIENEPFLPYFGECPPPAIEALDKEIALARSLDNRPIVVTDSGELSIWVRAAKRSDIFGTSLYRDTYSQHLKRYIHYPIGPGFFRFKRNITRLFAKPKEWVVIEMQAEPWAPRPFQEISREERERTMSFQKFKDMIEFSSKTGFNKFYLWGAEYWYWERVVNNIDDFWDYARTLFNGDLAI